jgi:hypothetical protein
MTLAVLLASQPRNLQEKKAIRVIQNDVVTFSSEINERCCLGEGFDAPAVTLEKKWKVCGAACRFPAKAEQLMNVLR